LDIHRVARILRKNLAFKINGSKKAPGCALRVFKVSTAHLKKLFPLYCQMMFSIFSPIVSDPIGFGRLIYPMAGVAVADVRGIGHPGSSLPFSGLELGFKF